MTFRKVLQQEKSAHHDKAVSEVTRIGPPPYATEAAFEAEQAVLEGQRPEPGMGRMVGDVLFAPGFTLSQSYI